MTIRFGLLGAGRIGKVHAKAVSGDAGAKLVAVADALPAAAQAIADQYGCETRSIEAILASHRRIPNSEVVDAVLRNAMGRMEEAVETVERELRGGAAR